ncbi:hypothetical protein V5E97_12895 [Singulisphaera sp. Ch08]|uniref:Uncharacterized protein n=1 Tax=Singulisphaera sp. Ch08 TaxID=3120278 RepID=A0AAU7CNJ7_9BACT
MAPRLPTAEEINVFDSLDERCAVKNFLGKDLEQARSLFAENFRHFQEDLMWMGPKAFAFYVPAAINYLLSEEADNAAGEVSSFCDLIEFRLQYEPAETASVGPMLREGILKMLENFGRYGFGGESYGDIYGNVAARYRALLLRLDGSSR